MRNVQSDIPWILIIIAVIGDFVVPYILALVYPDYSHKKHVMSLLGSRNSPVGKIYNSWLVILGLLFCISSVKIYSLYVDEYPTIALIILLIMFLYGIGGGILAGLFSVDEARDRETISSKIHGIGAGIGFMVLTFLPLVIGILFFKEKCLIFGVVSVVMFIISLAFFLLFIMSEKKKYENSVISQTGLWQRLLLASMYIPLLLLACSNLYG